MKTVIIMLITVLALTSCTSSHLCTGVVSKQVINKYKPVKRNFAHAKYRNIIH
jgi:hypothetical protein